MKTFTRKATKSRKTVANVTRNTQMPAYCPTLCGVKCDDQRGVDFDAKKTISIESMPIMDMSEVEVDMGVDVAIDPVSVAMAPISVDIDISRLGKLLVLVEPIEDVEAARLLGEAKNADLVATCTYCCRRKIDRLDPCPLIENVGISFLLKRS
jgi:hypothetical protein